MHDCAGVEPGPDRVCRGRTSTRFRVVANVNGHVVLQSDWEQEVAFEATPMPANRIRSLRRNGTQYWIA